MIWNQQIKALAETGGLPDVMLVQRLELTLPLNALADISDFYAHDSDTQYIFESLQNDGVYDGVRYAVPTFFYPEYWFVNLDILTNAGIAKPSYNWTWDQMESIAQACYDESTHTIGQYGVSPYYRLLPKQLSGNPSWQSFTFDGEKFNFDSIYFENAMNKLVTALSSHTVTLEFGSETLEEYYGDQAFNPRYGGKVAIWSAPSWEAKDQFAKMSFNWDVYPGPGGSTNGNIDIMGVSTNGNIDIMGVSTTCTEKAAAYQLLKWMTYSKQGLIARNQMYQDYKDVLFISSNNYPYPIADYGIDKTGTNPIWDTLPYNDVPGMTSGAMIESIRNAAVFGNKEVPGWDAADVAAKTYFGDLYEGKTTFAAIKETVVNDSTTAFQEARARLDAILRGESVE